MFPDAIEILQSTAVIGRAPSQQRMFSWEEVARVDLGVILGPRRSPHGHESGLPTRAMLDEDVEF